MAELLAFAFICVVFVLWIAIGTRFGIWEA